MDINRFGRKFQARVLDWLEQVKWAYLLIVTWPALASCRCLCRNANVPYPLMLGPPGVLDLSPIGQTELRVEELDLAGLSCDVRVGMRRGDGRCYRGPQAGSLRPKSLLGFAALRDLMARPPLDSCAPSGPGAVPDMEREALALGRSFEVHSVETTRASGLGRHDVSETPPR